MLRVHLLGQPRLTFVESPFAFSGRPKVLPLLAYLLLLDTGAALERSRIAAALWPDDTDAVARANLRRHLHYLQTLLPAERGTPWLLIGPRSVRWNPDADLWLDVDEFRRCADDPDRREQAVGLYAGDLLDGFDEAWMTEPRRELGIAYTSCLLALIGAHRARRAFPRAQQYARALLAYDPWREDALRQLLVIHYDSGDRNAAIREYRRFAQVLMDEMGVEPMPETQAVHRSIENGIAPPGSTVPNGVPSIGAYVEPPFVGRATEMARLTESWRRAADGEGRVVSVTGPAGIGKSRIARECAVVAEARGGLVAFGSTDAREATPYQAVIGIVRGLASFLPTVRIDPVWLSAISALIPEVRAYAPELPELAPLDPQRERTRLFEAVAALIEASASRRPLCAIVEDLHWAGAATIDLCAYLPRRLRQSRILWLMTWREEAGAENAPLRAMRRQLVADGVATQLALGPLVLAETSTMLEQLAIVDEPEIDRAARRLHELSGGNPFYALEFAHNPAVLRADASIPANLREAVLARIGVLDENARAFAQVAAVIGSTFDIEIVAQSIGWYESEANDALDALVRCKLVVERRDGKSLEFSHHLIQAAIYDATDAETRKRRHHRVGRALEQLHGEQVDCAAEIARHYALAGEGAPASRWFQRAARFALTVYANEEAEKLALQALEHAEAARDRFDALELAERAATLRGDLDARRRYADELSRAAVPLGQDDRCHALRVTIDLAHSQSDLEREIAAIDRLEREAENASPRWRASALSARAKLLRTTGAFEEEARCFASLVGLGEERVGKELLDDAYLSHADTLIFQGRLAEAKAILERLRATLEEGDRTTLSRLLTAFSRAALAQQDYDAMTDYAREAYEVSRSIGDVEGQALALHNIANGMVYTFDVDAIRDTYHRAMSIYDRLGHQVGLASVNVDYGLFQTEIGLLDPAMEYYERALAIARAIDFRFVICVANVNVGYCKRLRGDLAWAARAATDALAFACDLRSVHLEAAALGTLAAAERELGDLKSALAHFERGVELRRTGAPSPRLGDNLSGLAATQLLAGQFQRAQHSAAELMTMYDANPRLAPQPTEWLWTAARVYRACGEVTRAEALTRAAMAVAESRAAAIADLQTRAAFLDLPFNRALHTRC